MKSFFPWIGGKSQLAKQIVSKIPDNIGRYVEVFGGGGSVLFKREPQKSQLEVYNDVNSNLVNLFRCVKYHREELQRELSLYLNSREMFLDIRDRLKCGGFTDIQRAAMFYLEVRLSFGADCDSFGCNRKSFGVDYLEKIEERLRAVVIENKDFDNLIKVYDRPNALFYCDPPYHNTEKYYAAEFKNEDHERLKQRLSGISGLFLLSYNDDEYIRDLYKDFNIQTAERNNGLNAKPFKELIITNY